jgi:hypothetical protein
MHCREHFFLTPWLTSPCIAMDCYCCIWDSPSCSGDAAWYLSQPSRAPCPRSLDPSLWNSPSGRGLYRASRGIRWMLRRSFSRDMEILFVLVSFVINQIWGLTFNIFEAAGPQLVLFAGKNAILNIIVEDDLLKSPQYEWIRSDPKITNLITERDRAAYRQKVGPVRFWFS